MAWSTRMSRSACGARSGWWATPPCLLPENQRDTNVHRPDLATVAGTRYMRYTRYIIERLSARLPTALDFGAPKQATANLPSAEVRLGRLADHCEGRTKR